MLDGLNGLDSKLVSRYASAVLNDLPLKVDADGRTVRIAFGKQGLKIEGQLNTILGALLMNGGVIAGDVKQRVERLSQLPTLPDGELKKELTKAVDDLVRALPDDLVSKVSGDVNAAKKQIEDQKELLKKFIDDNANVDGRKLLAQVFAGGLVIVTGEGGQIIALERPITEEAKRFHARIEAFKRQVEKSQIRKLAEAMDDRWKAINNQVKTAQDE